MVRLKWNGIVSVLGVIVIGIGLYLWPLLRVRQLNKSFGQITADDSRDLVLKKMGAPWKDGACGDLGGGAPVGCVEELVYAHPYAPLAPEYWIVDFKSDRHMIEHSHLVSP